MVKLLIESRAYVNAVDKDGHTALDASADAIQGKQDYTTSPFPKKSKIIANPLMFTEGREQVIRLLEQSGAEYKGKINWFLLLVAIHYLT